MKIVYISAPITGQEDTAQQRFRDAEKTLIERGCQPVNPYEVNKGFVKWEDAVMQGLRLLRKCDAIYQCEGWYLSTGCRVEYEYAKGMGLEFMRQNV